ncbi:MAG: carbohydrate-binding domain-containing protein [Elusimicrobiota bacterium]
MEKKLFAVFSFIYIFIWQYLYKPVFVDATVILFIGVTIFVLYKLVPKPDSLSIRPSAFLLAVLFTTLKLDGWVEIAVLIFLLAVLAALIPGIKAREVFNLFDLSLLVSVVAMVGFSLIFAFLLKEKILNWAGLILPLASFSVIYFIVLLLNIRFGLTEGGWKCSECVVVLVIVAVVAVRIMASFVFTNVGLTKEKNGDYEAAIRAYKAAVVFNKVAITPILGLERLYGKTYRFDELIPLLIEYCSVSPNADNRVIDLLVEICLEHKKYPELLKIVPYITPSSPVVIIKEMISLDTGLFNQNTIVQAVNRVKNGKPRDSADIISYARVSYKLGQWVEAIRYYKLADTERFEVDDWMRYGTAYIELGDYQQAWGVLQKGHRYDKKDLGILWQLGCIASVSGNAKDIDGIIQNLMSKRDGMTTLARSKEQLTSNGLVDGYSEKMRKYNKNWQFLPESSSIQWLGQGPLMYSTGKTFVDITFPEDIEWFAVELRGSPVNDVWPLVEIYVNNDKYARFYVTSSVGKYYFVNQHFPKGRHIISINFINDYYIPETKEDRNVFPYSILLGWKD